MPITRSARGAAALSLLAALVACSTDSTGVASAPLDAARAQADAQAVQASFATPAVQSFATLGVRFGADGGFGLATAAGVPAVRGDQAHVARAAAAIVSGQLRSAVGIPAAARGKTFVYDPTSHRYVVSARPGAPATGARFILYAIDLLTHEPVVTSEVGYADVIELALANPLAVGLRILVVGGDTTYLDYTVTGTLTSLSAATIAVSGFVTDGATRVNFAVTANAATTGQQTAVNVAFTYSVPSRALTVSGAAQEAVNGTTVVSQIELEIKSGAATVGYVFAGTGDALDASVSVNGSLFAHIGGSAGAPVITGAGGRSLTADETTALAKLLALATDAFAFLDHLLAPVGGVGP